MIIIGIDPGVAITGFGIIESYEQKKRKRLKYLSAGCIRTSPSLAPEERLKKIHTDLLQIIKKYKPDVMAVEKIFFFKNSKTVMMVSEAKGVIMLTAAKKKLPVYEFTPLQVKMNITGYGRADKKQVQKMIKLLLELKDIPRPDDVADALGIAICYTDLKKP